jgi:hypothetical protein
MPQLMTQQDVSRHPDGSAWPVGSILAASFCLGDWFFLGILEKHPENIY